MNAPDYPTVCKYVGQLFLDSRHEIEQLHQQVRDLRARLDRSENERDSALETLRAQRGVKE